MSKDKYKITRLTNRKPIDVNKIQTTEKDGGIVMNYHEKIITQIIEAQEKREFECICAEIQKFIEENNIGVCFVINKAELVDCLQEHQKLKLEISDLEAKLAESEEKYNATNRAYWELVEKQDNDFLQYEKLIGENQQLKQQLAEKDEQLKLTKWDYDVVTREYYKLFNTADSVIERQDQDKISFAVHNLRQLKIDLNARRGEYYTERGYKKFACSVDIINTIIDDQIKLLKGE